MQIDQFSTVVKVTFPRGQDGPQQLTIHYPGEVSVEFDRERAVRYATALLAAVAYAEHDAAVLNQMQHQIGASPSDAAHVVRQMRRERPPLDHAALGVLRPEPAVLSRSSTPFLRCSAGGSHEWMWRSSHAIEHANLVLLCGTAADLAIAYWRFLVGALGAGEDVARFTVAELERWRYRADAASAEEDQGHVFGGGSEGVGVDAGGPARQCRHETGAAL